MKRRVFAASVIILFFLMLCFPSAALSGASRGLLLWFRTVLPALLPFMIMANLMIRTNAVLLLSDLLGTWIGKVFHVSGCGAFAVIAGFLCGYPMGAKVTADLLKEHKISRREADYLLSFCNNISPVFIVNYVAGEMIPSAELKTPSIFILFLAPLLCSRIFYIYKKRKGLFSESAKRREKDGSPYGQVAFSEDVVDICMMDGFVSIAKVGGYMMLFSVLMEMICSFSFNDSENLVGLFSFLEVTTGIAMLADLSWASEIKWILILSLTSFGGLCAAAQTYGMIRESGLRIGAYITEKLVTCAVTSLLCLFYLWMH